MQNLKCHCCLKLLAKIGQFDQIEIKCPRCKTLNNFQSTLSALPERPERLDSTGKLNESNYYRNTAIQS
ncbi:Com family DNA-binding transcriptional regulator [Acinetobacter sp. A47]|uniref:Com family DNA-binding transcriptional regulator n=1 Tax=Acinetobacter sp. A47 TaxID=1561217 RepID=UPI0009D6FD77